MQTLARLASIFSELWEWIYERLFQPEYDYSYISVNDSGILSLQNIIIGIMIGFFIAACMSVFDRRVLGDFVRRVLSCECCSKETAMTLEELGYLKNSIIRGSLKNGVSLRRVVKCVEEEEFNEAVVQKRAAFEAANADKKAPAFREPKFRMDTSTMHYYIPEEMKYMADVKFDKKGTNGLTVLLAFLVFLVLAVVALLVLPEILQMLDNVVGMFDQKSNILT